MAVVTSTTNKNITFRGTVSVDGVPTVDLSASISTDHPALPAISRYETNPELYRDNRDAVNAEIEKFEDTVYAEYDKMMSDLSTMSVTGK